MLLGFFRVFMSDIQINMVFTALFHFTVDGTCHDITRSKRQTRIVFLHKLLTTLVFQHGTVTAHGFSDEEAGTVARMKEGSGMELNELHIFHCAFGTIYHGNTVTGCYQRIGGIAINGFTASCGHNSHFG